MRHAKTESPYTLKRDFDRELTEKGRNDARQMGQWLMKKDLLIDRVLCSSAVRTRQTTAALCEPMKLDPSILHYRDDLYHADPETFYHALESVPNEIHCLLIVSHNQGITDFANQLTTTRSDHMQPGSVFSVGTNSDQWDAFKKEKQLFLFYRSPDRKETH